MISRRVRALPCGWPALISDAKLLQGDPAGAIVDAAKRGGYHLIALGTHGRTGLHHLLLGSVAEKVVRTARVPVCAIGRTAIVPGSQADDRRFSMKATALIVDDDHDLRDALCEVLQQLEGFTLECLPAVNGREALAICDARGADIDLVLLDLLLPDSDGISLVHEIRACSPLCQVLIITGNASIESAIAAVGEGAFAFVLKPFRRHELLRVAGQALSQTRLLREHDNLRAKLQESERRHREVVEAVPAFVLALDGAGNIILWNRHLEEVTGYSREEMLDRPGWDLVATDGDRTLPLKGGGHRMVRWRRTELGSSGPERAVYAIGIDVTEEREMLRRTMRAERLAAVGTLAAGLAHEVRNPLNSALLQLQVLKRRLERGETLRNDLTAVTDLVHDEIKRLERLVDDFLAFAQARPLELKPVNVNELVISLFDLLGHEAERAAVHIECELAESTGLIEGEHERLRQVLLNLMRNGIEAMVDGGHLTVRTRIADDRGMVAIEVEDDGPGFPEDAPIFDAFYTTKPGGTGLGLAIAHRIVAEHGGTIGVESRPGRTCFVVRLPQHHAEPG